MLDLISKIKSGPIYGVRTAESILKHGTDLLTIIRVYKLQANINGPMKRCLRMSFDVLSVGF